MDFELHVVKGRSATQALKLMDGVNVVGRLDDCTIRIKSSQVSRKHCEFFQKQGMLLVKDLKSANGTFVNGKKVDGQQVLEPGDELTIGSIRLRVAKIGQVPPTRPVAAPAAKSSDTAVAEVVSASDDVEFEIDFDDEPATAAVVEDAIEIDLGDEPLPVEIDQPAPKPPAAAAPMPPDKPKAAESKKTAASPSPEPTPEPAAEMADEAIADFLLDIKLDEED